MRTLYTHIVYKNLLIILMMLVSFVSNSQTTIWSETFTRADNTTTGTASGGTAPSGWDADYFAENWGSAYNKVVSNKLKLLYGGEPGYYYDFVTDDITITGYTTTTITFDYTTVNAGTNYLYVDVYLDGGYSTSYSYTTNQSVSFTVANGYSTLMLDIYNDHESGEYSTIDNLIVSGTLVSSSTNYFRSLATGNWQTAGTWQSSPDNSTWMTSTLVPTNAATSVNVQTGHTVTVNGVSTSGNLSTTGTGTLTLGANLTVTGTVTAASTSTIAVDAYTLTVSGTTTISGTLSITSGSVDANGTFDASAGAVTFAGAGNLYLGGAVAAGGLGTFVESTSTVTYDYAGAQTVDSDTYYHFVCAGSGAKTLAGAIIVLGNVTLSGGVLTQSTYAINVAGNWTSSGNYYTEGTGTVTFDGTGTSTVSSTSSYYGATTSTVLATETFGSAGTIPGTWTQEYNSGTTDYIYGAGGHAGGSILADHSAVGTSNAQLYCEVSGGAKKTKIYTPVLDLSSYASATVNFWYAQEDWEGDQDKLRVYYKTSAGGGWTLIQTYSSNVSSWTEVTLTLPSINSTYYIAFEGEANYGYGALLDDITVYGTTTGTALTGETFNTSAFNKTGAGKIVLASDVVVNTQLTLTAGYHDLATYTLQMGHASSTAPILTYTAGGFYSATDNGSFKRYIPAGAVSSTATPFYGLFPFKKTATNLSVLELNSTSNVTTGGFITATPKFASTVLDITDLAVGGGGGSTVTHVKSGKMIGMALTTIAGGTIDVKVSSGTFTAGTASNYTLVNYYTGVTATVLGTFVTQTASTTLPVITRTGVPTASLAGGITVGTFNIGATALPIELTTFKGYKSGQDNELSWTTATELNNDYFTIEKTYDGSTFEIVSTKNGAGNSTQNIDYFLTDYNVRPVINYYRLKQTDFDGQFTVSEVIAIDNTIVETSKEVVMKTNILGQEVNDQYRGLVVIVYADGTSIKIIQ